MEDIIYPRARKSLGQHFLHSEHHINRIIKAAVDFFGVGSEVLEVGPGRGILTRTLLNHFKLSVVELDSTLFDLLPSNELVEKYNIDFCNFVFNHQCVIGNLPYNRSVAMIIHCLKNEKFKKGIFMIQKEVADKIVSSEINRLSFIFNSAANVRRLFNVPGSCFSPSVPVTSTLIEIQSKAMDISWAEIEKSKPLFNFPRKKIRNFVSFDSEFNDLRLHQLSFSQLKTLIKFGNIGDISNH